MLMALGPECDGNDNKGYLGKLSLMVCLGECHFLLHRQGKCSVNAHGIHLILGRFCGVGAEKMMG